MSSFGRRAFTLIELIVVIGIIAASAGILGLALRGDNPSVALQSAQGTVASMLAAARSQAALNNAPAAFLVCYDPSDSDHYLHALTIGVQSDGAWIRTSDYVMLPTGVYIVAPGTSGFPNPGALATLSVDNKNYLDVVFSPVGTVTTSAGNVVLATANRSATPGPPQPTETRNIRGLILSAYGAVTFVNDSDGFQ